MVFSGAVTGEGFTGPKALHPGSFLAFLTRFMAADRAFRGGAGVGIDEDVGLASKVSAQDLFQLLDFGMAGLQAQVPGQDEVKVHENVRTAAAGPELVDINPQVPTMPGDNFTDLL